MDPLSATASIVTILGISTQVLQYIRGASGATSDRARLYDEVLACECILKSLSFREDDEETTDSAWNRTMATIRDGQDAPVARLAATLGQVKSKLERRCGTKDKLVWPFEKKETEATIMSIGRLRSMLQLALTYGCGEMVLRVKETADEIKQGVDNLTNAQHDLRRQSILDWITPVDYEVQQHDFRARRQPGTGQWLLDSPEYKTWKQARQLSLFCPGIPGAGKTIITSIVVDDLVQQYGHDENIGIAYIYCDYRRHGEQRAASLIASLLKQLVQRMPTVPSFIDDLFKKHGEKDSPQAAPLNEIRAALVSVAALFDKLFFVVDALDECRTEENCRAIFLAELLALKKSHGINLFATSRHIPEITERFKSEPTLHISARQDDVSRFLISHMDQLPAHVQKNPELQRQICEAISSSVRGMFLLAQIYLSSLKDKVTPKAVRTALRQFRACNRHEPEEDGRSETNILSQAYAQAMERISSQPQGFRDLAKRVLAWISCAERPLQVEELRHALAVEPETSALDDENLTEVDQMVSVCAGLVTVDELSGNIRLVHHTTQEYLITNRDKWFPDAEIQISSVCATYLSFDVFNNGPCDNLAQLRTRLKTFPLYRYAAGGWGHHAAAAGPLGNESQRFLKSGGNVVAAMQIWLWVRRNKGLNFLNAPESIMERLWEPRQEALKRLTPLHLVAACGVEDAITRCGPCVHPCDSKDGMKFYDLCKHVAPRGVVWDLYQSPLVLAAEGNHDGVVAKLLAMAEEMQSASTRSLDAAAPDQEEDFAGRDVVPDYFYQDAFAAACSHGSVPIAKTLLATGRVDPHRCLGVFRRGALTRAAEGASVEMVQLILSLKPPMEQIQSTVGTAAALSGGDILKLLLAVEGIDPNAPSSIDLLRRTPLMRAAEAGRDGNLEILLSTPKVNCEARDKSGATALAIAAKSGRESTVKLMLARKDLFNTESRDHRGWTPLQAAISTNSINTAQLLLAESDRVDPDACAVNGRSALSLAAWPPLNSFKRQNMLQSYPTIVDLLLATGRVAVNSQDNKGRSPLSWAAEGFPKALSALLASAGADPDLRDNNGRTPLSWAAQKSAAAVQLLLATDKVDINSQDVYGCTPLLWAIRDLNDWAVEMLLQTGKADLHTRVKETGVSPWDLILQAHNTWVFPLGPQREGLTADGATIPPTGALRGGVAAKEAGFALPRIPPTIDQRLVSLRCSNIMRLLREAHIAAGDTLEEPKPEPEPEPELELEPELEPDSSLSPSSEPKATVQLDKVQEAVGETERSVESAAKQVPTLTQEEAPAAVGSDTKSSKTCLEAKENGVVAVVSEPKAEVIAVQG